MSKSKIIDVFEISHTIKDMETAGTKGSYRERPRKMLYINANSPTKIRLLGPLLYAKRVYIHKFIDENKELRAAFFECLEDRFPYKEFTKMVSDIYREENPNSVSRVSRVNIERLQTRSVSLPPTRRNNMSQNDIDIAFGPEPLVTQSSTNISELSQIINSFFYLNANSKSKKGQKILLSNCWVYCANRDDQILTYDQQQQVIAIGGEILRLLSENNKNLIISGLNASDIIIHKQSSGNIGQRPSYTVSVANTPTMLSDNICKSVVEYGLADLRRYVNNPSIKPYYYFDNEEYIMPYELVSSLQKEANQIEEKRELKSIDSNLESIHDSAFGRNSNNNIINQLDIESF